MANAATAARMAAVSSPPLFRDPVSVEDQAVAIEHDIARVLVRAPTLPVDVPMFSAQLLGVVASPDDIGLAFGREGERLALLLLSWSEQDEQLKAKVRWEGPRRPRAFEAAMTAIAQRLSRSITRPEWEQAWELRERALVLPRNIPLEAYRAIVPGSRAAEGLVRTGFGCNQRCGLCWQGRHWGRFPSEQILTWIEDIHAAGAETLIISGGEPTLDPALPEYIRRARELGFSLVTLETNAVQLAKAGHAAKLREAGLTRAFVSLHSGDAATSDAVTGAPGTHARTVAGIAALLDAGVRVALNCVLTSQSLPTAAGLPDFVRSTFGRHPMLETLVISDLGAIYDDALLPTLIPPPDRARAALKSLVERAVALQLPLNGLRGSCGPPLCHFDADPRVIELEPIPEPVSFRTYAKACARCAVRHACFGVRRSHLEMFGERSVFPLESVPTLRT